MPASAGLGGVDRPGACLDFAEPAVNDRSATASDVHPATRDIVWRRRDGQPARTPLERPRHRRRRGWGMRSLLPSDPAVLRRLAAGASLGLATLLALLKLGAAVATGSLAVLSSLIDSLADIVASAITFVSVQISPAAAGPRAPLRPRQGREPERPGAGGAGGRLGHLRPDRRRTSAGQPGTDPVDRRWASRSWRSPSSRRCSWSRSRAMSSARPARRRSAPTACITGPTC